VPTLFLKNVITNFQAVFSNREQEQIGVDDGNQDAPVFAWNESEFKSAKQTRWRTKKVAGEAVVDPVAQRSFDIVKDAYGPCCSNAHLPGTQPDTNFSAPGSHKSALNEARRQRRDEGKDYDLQCENAKLNGPDLIDTTLAMSPIVDEWFQHECKQANPDQQVFLEIVAKRVKEEMHDSGGW
jgi:hypothetical protein